MKQRIFNILCILFLALLAQTGSAAEKLWVSSQDAKLKAEQKSSSETLAELPVGSELNVIAYDKRWYNVTTSGNKTGWVYRGKVSEEKPEMAEKEEDEGSLGSLLGDMSGSSIDAESADSSRSIRGLSPEAQEYAKQSGTPVECRKALDKVLAVKTENAEIENFMKKGKVGEYAE